MSNSSLVTYTKISPNKTSPRTHQIDTITIHCMAGQMTAKSCVDMFYNNGKYDVNKASSNYCIGYDGSIGLSVAEVDRSWCSSNGTNDHRAITIEVASDNSSPYKVKDAAYQSLLNLVTDICKRNKITKLVWSENKTERINHTNGCNMTVHRDFANKACPGAYLMGKMPEIAKTVNARLNPTTTSTTTKTTEVYRVRKYWKNSSSQKGAFSELKNAQICADNNPGYCVYNSKGTLKYPSVSAVAKQVVKGYWGNGTERKTALTNAGYDYDKVQAEVTKLMKG